MSNPKLHAHLRRRLALAIELSGMSQAEVARKAGIPKQTLSHQLNQRSVTLDVLWAVAPVVRRDVRWFFPGDAASMISPSRMPDVLARIEAALDWGRNG